MYLRYRELLELSLVPAPRLGIFAGAHPRRPDARVAGARDLADGDALHADSIFVPRPFKLSILTVLSSTHTRAQYTSVIFSLRFQRPQQFSTLSVRVVVGTRWIRLGSRFDHRSFSPQTRYTY